MTDKKISLKKSILLVIPVAAYLGLLIFIITLLKLEAIWLGFLLLWYWGMVKNASFEELIKSVLPGSITGIGLSFLFKILPEILGSTGIIVSGLVIISVLICSFTGWIHTFVNGASFLFLTVLTIPVIAEKANYLDFIQVIVVCALYIGITSWLMRFRKATRK